MTSPLSETAIEFIGLEFQRRLPVILGPSLVFGFIFGSVAKDYACEGHDLDVFICLKQRRPQGEKLMLSWLADLQERYGLSVDANYPAEITTAAEIKGVVETAGSVTLQLGINDSKTFDKVVWIEAIAGKKFAAVGDLSYLKDLERACSSWPAVWTQRYREKIGAADPLTLLRKAVHFKERTPAQASMLQEQGLGSVPPSKAERLQEFYRQMRELPNAANGLETYQQICTVINSIEDEYFGLEDWHIPRSFNSGAATQRLYPPQPDNFEPVPGFSGVTNMVLKREFIFVSQFGAIEVQKDNGTSEAAKPYHQRRECVVFEKRDSAGRAVWDNVNRDL